MIPLRDSVRPGRTPFVNWALILINLYVFYQEAKLFPDQLNQVFYSFGVIPADVTHLAVSGASLGPVVLPFFTAMFLHGGWMHVLGNMLFLFIFGDNVEDRLGHARYLLFYLAVGIVGSVGHVLANPTSTAPVVGASGAVAGILGAYIVSFPGSRVLSLVPIFFFFTIMELPAVIFIALWFIIQLFNGVASLGGVANSVAWWAHVGGFIAGAVLIKLLVQKRPTHNY